MDVLNPVILISNDETLARVLGDYARVELGRELKVESPQNIDKSTACSHCLWDVSSAGAVPAGVQATPLHLPVRLRQFASLIKSLPHNSRQTVWQGAGEKLEFDPSLRSLHKGEQASIGLTDKEAALLAALLAAGDKGASRDALTQGVWGYEAEAQTLTTHLYRLRGKLKQLAGEAEIIAATENGYRLNKG